MTPAQYKAKYTSLKVKRKNGTIETVRVSRYVLNHSTVNTAAMEAFRSKYFSRGIDTDLTILSDSGEVTMSTGLTRSEDRFRRAGLPGLKISIEKNGREDAVITKNGVDWGGLAVYSFLGKGAPEHCQVVLQLAEHWGLATNGLQAYADSALGLDCNGFVGNYIWHGRKGNTWSHGGFRDLKGPDSQITNFFRDLPLVRRWEEINPSHTYLLGLVDSANNVIPGGGSVKDAGHIMITEPGRRSFGHWDTYSPRLWVVESTGGAVRPGLSEGWYECLDYNAKTGVFTLDRGEGIQAAHREIRCKIALLG
ncbi:MAG: hypothetical protein IANPNBLG_01551 [Bryobacteraceae bacterium]|nr:hypothetical protein [Bryobacteraceae bacterium]